MALGVQGTGPHGRIQSLKEEIRRYKYELGLIAQGMRRKLGAKRLREMIAAAKKEIREIRDAQRTQRTS